MFSSTTMELSTSMPTARARPPRLIMFSVTPKLRRMTHAPAMERGMATPMTITEPRLRKKKRSTPAARAAPMAAEEEEVPQRRADEVCVVGEGVKAQLRFAL